MELKRPFKNYSSRICIYGKEVCLRIVHSSQLFYENTVVKNVYRVEATSEQ